MIYSLRLPVLMIFCGILFSCGEVQATDAEKRAHALLDGGARSLDCDKSFKMIREGLSRNGVFRDTSLCIFPRKRRFVTVTDEYVNVTSRCSINDIDAEYSVTVFKDPERNDYYGGYFCSVAQGSNFSAQKMGSLTEKEGPL